MSVNSEQPVDLSKLERRIALLLNQAEGTNHPEEAKTYREAAEKLMLRYGVDAARARRTLANETRPEQIVRETVTFTGIYAQAHVQVASYVCIGLGSLRCVQSNLDGRGRSIMLYVIGYESQVNHALTLLASVRVQAEVEQAAWWREEPSRPYLVTAMEKFKARRQFLVSFGSAVYDRLSKARLDAERDASADHESTTLALRDTKQEVDDATDRFFPHLSSRANRMHGSFIGGAAGRSAGLTADLGGTKLSGDRGRLGR